MWTMRSLNKIGSAVKVDDDVTSDIDDHQLDEDCSFRFPRRCLLESRQRAFALWTQVASRRTWKVTSEIIILQLIMVLIVSFDFDVFFIEGRSKCRKTRRPQSEDLLPHFQLVSAKILISIIRWHHLVHHKHILKYNYNNFHHGYVITSFSTLWIYSEL